MTRTAEVSTERLTLAAVTDADLDELHSLSSDPRVWQHFPAGRHTSREQTARQIEGFVAAWRRDGLGYWTARLREDDAFVGVGGCTLTRGVAWNVYYRIRPEMQGRGLASELVAAARAAAAQVRPDLPVVAYLVEHNLASRRTAERAGLRLAWRGPDAGNPDPDAVRLIFTDRELGDEALAVLTTRQ